MVTVWSLPQVDLDLIVLDDVPVCDCDMFLNGSLECTCNNRYRAEEGDKVPVHRGPSPPPPQGLAQLSGPGHHSEDSYSPSTLSLGGAMAQVGGPGQPYICQAASLTHPALHMTGSQPYTASLTHPALHSQPYICQTASLTHTALHMSGSQPYTASLTHPALHM